MTTTDARKRNRDMRDAHETARERDARAKAGHPIEWFVFDETHTFTREHLTEWQQRLYDRAIAPTTQSRDAAWMPGALDGTGPRDRTHDDQETDTMTEPQTKTEWLADIAVESHRTNELLTEIRDRLPERVEAKVDRLDEPGPVPRPDPACVCGSVDDFHLPACCDPAVITEEPPVGSRLMDRQWSVWRRGERGWGIEGLIPPGSNFDNLWSTVQQYAPLTALDEPAPADVDPDEAWARERWAESANIASWSALHPETQRVLVDFARSAREHLRDEMTAEMWRGIGRVEDEAEEREARLKAKADRYDALREDVKRYRDGYFRSPGDILRLDEKRAES